jgi:hypothetical protein
MRLVPEAAICKYDELILSAKELLMDEQEIVPSRPGAYL